MPPKMVPISKKKMDSFFKQHDGAPEINAHGLGSPPRPAVANDVAVSASSPLGPRHTKAPYESLRIPPPSFNISKFGNGTVKPPDTLQIKTSASQRPDEPLDLGVGWESAPPHLERDDEHEGGLREREGGLRERWEEQSNIHSLFSESAPTRPTSRQTGRDFDVDDTLSTKSDLLGSRPRPHQGRNSHKVSESPSFVERNRAKLQVLEKKPYIGFKDGKFDAPGLNPKSFSASLITHAPRSSMPENPVFREDPFDTTSEDTGPQTGRDTQFLHSSFPYRGSDVAKAPTHLERAAFHVNAARRLSPEKYDIGAGAAYPQKSSRPTKEAAMGRLNAAFFHSIEDRPLTDSDDGDSDIPSQGDELEQQQLTPKALKQKAATQDVTMILNPQKPIISQKPQKTVVLQDDVLPGSPMARFPAGQKSPPKKRRRNIDYDDDMLQRMSFTDLQNEPFDHDPTRELVQSPAKPRADNLDDRLHFYRAKDENVQSQFFTQMSVRDWEDSGDWFLEQFGNIVDRMRGARQRKRKMVDDYEMEVSIREEAVRRKKESIDRKLSKLKQDGDAMMKGKEIDE